MTLKILLKQKGFTQREFGEKMGVVKSTVSNWCNGANRPTLSKIREMANVLGVSSEEILNAIEETNRKEAEKNIGQIIRELRGPLSLRDFADKCGVCHTTIDNLEKGVDFRTGNPTQTKLATIQKIAEACDVPVSYIIGEKTVAITDEMKAALFGPGVEVTDEMWEKVKEFAEFLKFKAQKGEVVPNT